MIEATVGIFATVAVIFIIGLFSGKPSREPSKKAREVAALRRQQEELRRAIEVLSEKKTRLKATEAAMRGSTDNERRSEVFPSSSQGVSIGSGESELAKLGIGRA